MFSKSLRYMAFVCAAQVHLSQLSGLQGLQSALLSFVVQKFAARARDRHPGGEILSRYDWLIDTMSYFDWLVFYEAGKFAIG